MCPIGEQRADDRLSMLIAAIYNRHRGPRERAWKPKDFPFRYDGEPKARHVMSAAEITAGLTAFAHMHNMAMSERNAIHSNASS